MGRRRPPAAGYRGMIENLNGIYETVNFKQDTTVKVYHNLGTEDYPSHWHTPLEIIMPYDKDYQVTVGTELNMLGPGDIAVICPGVLHSLHSKEYGRRFIFQAEVAPLQEIKSFRSILNLIFPAILITPQGTPGFYAQAREILEQIDKEYKEKSFVAELSVYSLLLNLFILIGSNYAGQEPLGADSAADAAGNSTDSGSRKKYGMKFVTVCNYINEHCTENLTLDKIASLAGFSKYHFSRLFKQFTGVSFYKYLNQKRIACAQKLLLNPDMSITEITFQSGFTSLSAFIRMFKIFNRCTPSEYRQMRIHFV